jgi:hypothetical protein
LNGRHERTISLWFWGKDVIIELVFVGVNHGAMRLHVLN